MINFKVSTFNPNSIYQHLNFSQKTLDGVDSLNEEIKKAEDSLNKKGHITDAISHHIQALSSIDRILPQEDRDNLLKDYFNIRYFMGKKIQEMKEKKINKALELIEQKIKNDETLKDKGKAILRLGAIKMGKKYLSEVKAAWDTEWPKFWQEYNSQKNDEYPIRAPNGDRILIEEISEQSIGSQSGIQYDRAGILPFISSQDGERKGLYDRLDCVKFQKEHKKNDYEDKIIGQKTVIAI